MPTRFKDFIVTILNKLPVIQNYNLSKVKPNKPKKNRTHQLLSFGLNPLLL